MKPRKGSREWLLRELLEAIVLVSRARTDWKDVQDILRGVMKVAKRFDDAQERGMVDNGGQK